MSFLVIVQWKQSLVAWFLCCVDTSIHCTVLIFCTFDVVVQIKIPIKFVTVIEEVK